MSPLHELATAVGLQIDWTDALGDAQTVSADALGGVLHALGFAADSERAIAASREKLDAENAAGRDFLTADAGTPITLEAGRAAAGRAELLLEDGTRRDVALEQRGSTLRIPAIAEAGYHRLVIGDRVLRLAVAPERCFRVADAAPGKRI